MPLLCEEEGRLPVLLTGVWNLNLQFYWRHKMRSIQTWTRLFFMQKISYIFVLFIIYHVFLFYFCYVPSLKNKTNINFYKQTNIRKFTLKCWTHMSLEFSGRKKADQTFASLAFLDNKILYFCTKIRNSVLMRKSIWVKNIF